MNLIFQLNSDQLALLHGTGNVYLHQDHVNMNYGKMKNIVHNATQLIGEVMKFLIVLLMGILLTGCGKGNNRVESNYYKESDFSVQCLYGVKYLVRYTGGSAGVSFMTPKINSETLLPERCDGT